MKLIVASFFMLTMGLSAVFAQQNTTQPASQIKAQTANNKAIEDSLQRDKQNGTIYTKVNKDGIIEITKKELAKLPADRQEALRKDKNYKIIEDK